MPPKSKKPSQKVTGKKAQPKISKKPTAEQYDSDSASESGSGSDSAQSNLSFVELAQKDNSTKLNEELNSVHGGNDDDDKLVDYDEDLGEDDEENDAGEDDEVDADADAEVDVEDEKESMVKNDEMKDDDDDDCVYRDLKKDVDHDHDDDDEDEDNYFDDDIVIKNIYVTEENRITTRKLTKYERVVIIGTRAKQIELGAQKMVKNTKGLTPKEIAKLELKMKKCPIIVKRTLPSGIIELIDANTLNIVN